MDRPLAYCSAPGCTARVIRGTCTEHTSTPAPRPNADVRTWYCLERWFRLRRDVLRSAGYRCAVCYRVSARLDVDHVTPHHGDPRLFWLRSNLQALCATCHSLKTARGL